MCVNVGDGDLPIFFSVTAYAAMTTVQSSDKSFTVGSNDYTNYAKEYYYTGSNNVLSGYANITKSGGTYVQTGYLGSTCNIYKKTSSSYSLVASGSWAYNDDPCLGFANTTSMSDPSTNNYMSKGTTAVYYNGSYHTQATYATPYISVN